MSSRLNGTLVRFYKTLRGWISSPSEMDVLLQNFSQEIAGDMSGLLFFIIYFIPSGMLHDSLPHCARQGRD